MQDEPSKPKRRLSPEHRAKIAAATRRRYQDPEERRKTSESLKGRKQSAEHRAKHRAAMIGKTHTPEARAKMSAAHKGKRQGEDSPSWKGDDAGYQAIHLWLRRNFPKTGVCENCHEDVGPKGHRGTQYAFRFHGAKPYTRDPDDYLELCPACHNQRDVQERRAS